MNEKNYISEIKKNTKFFLENDFFEDIKKKKFFLLFDIIDKTKQKDPLKKQFISDLNQLNSEYNNNILNNKKKFKFFLENNKIILDQEENLLISKLYKKQKINFLKKKKIFLEFQNNINKIKKEKRKYFFKIINLEKKVFLYFNIFQMIIEKKNKFLLDKILFIKNQINNDFYNKNIVLNKEINNLKFITNELVQKLKDFYKNDLVNINNNHEKEAKILFLKNKEINNLFQKQLDNHNKIFEEERVSFLNNKDVLKNQRKILFQKCKIVMFFFIEKVFLNNYKNFIFFLKKVQKNELLYLTNLHIWRRKYIFLKLIYNKKLNWIFMQNKLLSNIKEIKIKSNYKLYEQEKEIIHNKKIQKINYFETDLRILEIIRKYKIMFSEFQEEYKKNELNFLNQNNNFQIFLKLHNLEYKKNILNYSIDKKEKKVLLKTQLQKEKVNLITKSCEYIIEQLILIRNLKKKTTNLKNIQQQHINNQHELFEQQKQDFFKRTQMTKIKTEYFIKQYFIREKEYSINLISYIKFIIQKDYQRKKIFSQIKKQLDFEVLNCQNFEDFFNLEKFELINNLIKLFFDNVLDQQFYYSYVLQKRISYFQDFIIKQKNQYNNIFCRYFEQNIFLMRNLFNKSKLKFGTKMRQKFTFIENKIKIYEQFYFSLKKKIFFLHKEKIYKNKFNDLKKKQNIIRRKYIFFQTKIFKLFNKIIFLKEKNFFFNKIFLNFYKKRIISCLFSFFRYMESISFFEKEYNNFMNYMNELKNNFDESQKEIIEQNEKNIFSLYNFLIDILKDIHLIQLQNIKELKKKEEDNLKNQIFIYKKIIKNNFFEMNNKIKLMNLNFREALIEKNKVFFKNLHQLQIEYSKKKIYSILQFNNKIAFFYKISNLKLNQMKAIQRNQNLEERKIFLSFAKIHKKYLKTHQSLLKKIENIKKKTKFNISKSYFKNKIQWLLFIIWFRLKNIKDRKEIKRSYKDNIKKLKNKIKIQIFFYNIFNYFFGI
ncbi:hypothetical protein FEF22_000445 [Texas Phoenix palm phytoplasma]|uniref:Uncharacterized protein n=1 Tax=Texas Phoenix palm phytoplasma TaxID=176709 RepID=A0ABS5BI51_9MOLU|nr:hypothetical protein [Texas Phoenix palm phytoplasma]MBP3059257.1 hypothetical protein [Texas Phoenix palm phytoplasma]